MTWFRLDDKFHGNPKVVAAGNAAVGLYVRCGTYCADHLTDGRIPTAIARLYGTKSEIAALIRTELWTLDGDHYVMPDFLDFNQSRDEVLHERAARSEAKARAGRAGGIASGEARRKQNRSNNEADTQADTQAELKRNEAPTRPDPLLQVSTQPPPPTECPAGGENPERAQRLDLIAAAAAHHALSNAKDVRDPIAYLRKAAHTAAGDPELIRLADLFPTAPPAVIAAARAGEKHSLRNYPRSDELATVHPIAKEHHTA